MMGWGAGGGGGVPCKIFEGLSFIVTGVTASDVNYSRSELEDTIEDNGGSLLNISAECDPGCEPGQFCQIAEKGVSNAEFGSDPDCWGTREGAVGCYGPLSDVQIPCCAGTCLRIIRIRSELP